MRLVYSIALYLSMPFILLHFTIRGLKDRGYLRRWRERFAFYQQPQPGPGIVIHAASVGELNAATPLIHELGKAHGTWPLSITTFTPTGASRARSVFGEKAFLAYAPLDLPGTVKKFFDFMQPRLLVIMETEIWPNLYHEARQRNIPILMANARLSVKSLKGYKRFGGLTRIALEAVSHLAAQSRADADRLISCGAHPDRVFVGGNLKFDISIPDGLADQALALRKQWGPDRPVLIAGSTHEEDDVAVLNALGIIRKVVSDPLLIIAPRHPERFSPVARLATGMGLRTERYSEGKACSSRADCFVIDTMGELMTYYACSDVALIGGSFGQAGGHNPLEAAALAKPVIVGPDTDNFTEITIRLAEAGAAFRVGDAGELGREAAALLLDPEKGRAMGQAGLQLVRQGKGALQHTLGVINRLLD
jgi:3-deoxy-D-manno-octulosonic-acid transferase